MKQKDREAFFRLVDTSGGTGACWNWIGACRGGRHNQYGNFRGNMAHRVSWEMLNGPIPDGRHICHKCDNPKCVRPDHLFVGTNTENSHDMMRKGRRKTDRTPEEIDEIRWLVAMGARQSDVAAEYGASRASICLVANRKQWVWR